MSAPFGLNAGGEETVTAAGVEFVPSPQDSVEVSGNHDAKPNETAIAVSGTENPISGTDNDELCGSLQYDDEVATENDACDATLYFFRERPGPEWSNREP